jgi:hypothetical protein
MLDRSAGIDIAHRAARSGPTASVAPLTAGLVSDPVADLSSKSSVAGLSQRDTHLAWCDQRVLAVFGDSGSVQETLPGGAGLSTLGYAVSTDAGKTFRDLGFVPSGPDSTYLSRGSAVAACSDPGQFDIVAALDYSPDGGVTFRNGVGLWRSTDGGETFGLPALIVSELALNVTFDSPWLAVDPITPTTLHVAYSRFSSGVGTCAGMSSAVELVTSTDGGQSWSSPIVADEICQDDNPGAVLQRARVVVGPDHEALTAWTKLAGLRGEIRVAAWSGVSMSAPVVATQVVPPGSGSQLQGFLGRFFSPSMDIDRTGGPRHGTLYIAWDDGSRNVVPDLGGTYAYADVFIVASTDRGKTWPRFPTRVNNNVEPSSTSPGTDQFLPALAVDGRGRVAICYYDRRRDRLNFMIDRYCSVSSNGGGSWATLRKTPASAPYLSGADTIDSPDVGFGDHDGLTADFLRLKAGFRGTYTGTAAGNMDVKSTQLQD